MASKPYTIDRIFRILIGLSIATGLFFLAKQLSCVLLPFLIGWILAYLIHPLVKLFQYKLKFKNRPFSVFCALASVLLIIGLLFWALIPAIVTEVSKLGTLFTNYIGNIETDSLLPERWKDFIISNFSKIDVNSQFKIESIQNGIQKILPQFWNIMSESVRFLVGIAVVFIVILYIIFILIDYEKIASGFIRMIPRKYRHFTEELILDVEKGMNKYFRGQALIAAIVGTLFAVGFSIIGLPLAITMGIFIGILNLVPYLQTIAVVPTMGLLLLKSAQTGQSFWWLLLAAFIVFAAIQTFQDLFLVPKIMGKAMGLNSAVILLSLSVWGALLGIAGMIIALPATTLLISYYKRFVLKDKNILPQREE